MDPPEFLDHEGAELVLIGGREAGDDLGIELEPQPESEDDAVQVHALVARTAQVMDADGERCNRLRASAVAVLTNQLADAADPAATAWRSVTTPEALTAWEAAWRQAPENGLGWARPPGDRRSA